MNLTEVGPWPEASTAKFSREAESLGFVHWRDIHRDSSGDKIGGGASFVRVFALPCAADVSLSQPDARDKAALAVPGQSLVHVDDLLRRRHAAPADERVRRIQRHCAIPLRSSGFFPRPRISGIWSK